MTANEDRRPAQHEAPKENRSVGDEIRYQFTGPERHRAGPGGRAQHVTVPADIVTTRHARRIRWHHVLVRRRRWSRELDRLLNPSDPWDLAEPIDWHAAGLDLGVPERADAGRELLAARWLP